MKPKAAFQYEQMVHDKVGIIPSGPSPPPIPPPPIPPPPVSLVGLPVSYADQEDGGDGGDYLDDQDLDGFVIVNPEDLYEGDFQAPDPESGYQRADHVILDQEFKPYSRPEMSKPDSSLFSLPVEVAKPELPFASRSFSPETSKYEPPTRPEATKSKPDIESFDGIRPYEVFSKKLDKSGNSFGLKMQQMPEQVVASVEDVQNPDANIFDGVVRNAKTSLQQRRENVDKMPTKRAPQIEEELGQKL